ncbi:hypothetical protein AU14_06715 [Marinobacter similis]|uniref:Uncharacterized protein n=1 Tax=Marinobacter similis TaxID=1420916 RepID=W5YMC0_9GAMM|nr:hypothetical protein AU14_06715 [Marinobacter similis]
MRKLLLVPIRFYQYALSPMMLVIAAIIQPVHNTPLKRSTITVR